MASVSYQTSIFTHSQSSQSSQPPSEGALHSTQRTQERRQEQIGAPINFAALDQKRHSQIQRIMTGTITRIPVN